LALISQESIDEVKRAVDIIEVVSGYVPLKRAGAGYKARCPFHEEKTPSFNVNPERQFFHCFGCGKSGDAISFVMSYEKVEYPDAIRILADKAGVTIRYAEGGGPSAIGREDLHKVNAWAAGVFRSLLQKAPEAEPARAFLARRGVSDEAAERFGLGFSMDSWDYLLQRARRAGFDEKLLAAAGLAVERDGKSGCYDRFRGRLIFPIQSPQGKVIAFGARTLKDEHPKFINSPETAIFSKGRGFYGLHLAKETFEETRAAYIVEGYMDVIVPHQAGVLGLVATLGTSLTREHLKILRRYVDKVVLVFDADAAGRKASERGLDLLLSENVDIFVAELPAGLDPDDVVLKHGPEALRRCLEKPREIFDFLMESLTRKHGGETPAAKARIVEEMLDRLGQIPDPVKQELLLQQLARRFNLEERTLRARLAPGGRAEGGRAEGGAAPVPTSALEVAARELLACASADPAVAARVRHELPAERYPTETLRRLAEAAYTLLERTGAVEGRELLRALQDPALVEAAAGILALDVAREEAARRVGAALETLERESFKAESRDRKARLRSATPEEEVELLRRAMEARRQRPRDHGLMPGR
jgi:DNA primase